MGATWREISGSRYFSIAIRLIVIVFIVTRGFSLAARLDAGDVRSGDLDPRGFKFLEVDSSGQPIRYPCGDLHYVINPANASPEAIEDVHVAVAETAEATGMTFVYDGTTDEPPAGDRDSFQPERYGNRWAPILVAWQVAPGDDHPVGLGGSEARPNSDGRFVYVSGQVVLNASSDLSSGFGGKTWGQVMLHEFGHVMGLDHVPTQDQVMFDVMSVRPAAWGHGDRAGLRALGIGSPCVRAADLP